MRECESAVSSGTRRGESVGALGVGAAPGDGRSVTGQRASRAPVALTGAAMGAK